MATSGYEKGYDDNRFDNAVSESFHCQICLNVFKKPMMCQRNQHYFCRSCIIRHLENSKTCPTCQEELTRETLSKAPRIVTDYLSELKIHCDYFSRGCREVVQLDDLEVHVKNCGFTPVMCSNEECLVEMNKRDRTHHESEICEFRKVKCHDCTEMRKEIDVIKVNHEVQMEDMKELKINVMEMKDKMKINTMEIKEQLATHSEQMMRSVQMTEERIMKAIKVAYIEGKNINSSVVVAGGCGVDERALNSTKIFDCSKKFWSPLQPLKEGRCFASSFVFKKQMIVNGGVTNYSLAEVVQTDSMETLNIDQGMDSEAWLDFPAKLPSTLFGHSCVVYNERLIITGGYDNDIVSDCIHEVLLVPPYTTKLLTRMPQKRCLHGTQLFNDNILVCGGQTICFDNNSCTDSVVMYDIGNNECKQMAPLPFVVSKMATVKWDDNVIIIGGAGRDGIALNTVVIYNVKTEKSHMLPEMKYKRDGCVAVVVGNTIIVIGGSNETEELPFKSVESFSFDRYSWEDLPPMNEARVGSTAVAW